MKISNKQVMYLIIILEGSCRIEGIMGGFDRDERIKLLNQIVIQQDDTIKDLTPNNKE